MEVRKKGEPCGEPAFSASSRYARSSLRLFFFSPAAKAATLRRVADFLPARFFLTRHLLRPVWQFFEMAEKQTVVCHGISIKSRAVSHKFSA